FFAPRAASAFFPPEDFAAPFFPAARDFEPLRAAVFFADFFAPFLAALPAAFFVDFFADFPAAFFAPPLRAPFFDALLPACFALLRSTISCALCSTCWMRSATRRGAFGSSAPRKHSPPCGCVRSL